VLLWHDGLMEEEHHHPMARVTLCMSQVPALHLQKSTKFMQDILKYLWYLTECSHWFVLF